MFDLPKFINLETWTAFVEMRKSNKKAPFTDFAQKLILKELSKFHAEGYDANSSLEQAIMNGWRGVFRAELRSGAQTMRITTKPIESFKERDARLGREKWERMTGQQHPDNTRSIVDVFTMDLLEFSNDQSH